MDREKLAKLFRDGKTIPNLITFGRLAVTPYVAYRYHRTPVKWAPWAGVIGVSDNVDGGLAKLGDKYPKLHRFGLRSSELGRKADPITDKIYNGSLLAVSFKNGVLDTPFLKGVAAASLMQKLAVGIQTYRHENAGIELSVRPMGRIFELLTNVGLGSVALAEKTEEEELRSTRKLVGGIIGAIGVAGACYETVQYYREGKQLLQQPLSPDC